MRKKALITGITGQDGSYLAEFLLEKGYEVHGIVRRSSSFNTERIDHIFQDPHVKDKSLILHYGDLADSSCMIKIIREVKPDEIYNLCAQSHVRVSFDIPEYTSDIVGLGTLRILEAIKNFSPQTKFYQASSSEMFGKAQEIPQKETTPFHPRSPYACAKVFAYHVTRNFRESYNLFACNGILFNHESPRRGRTFVTKKIIEGLVKIKYNLQDCLYLGNLEAKRDWGHAKDYVEAMWLMLQQNEPDDFVISTGETHSVREFLEESFKVIGIDAESNGKKGLEEEYIRKDTGKVIVKIDKKYFRPAEVDLLIGDSTKVKEKIGWEPKISFRALIEDMAKKEEKFVEKELNGFGNKIMLKENLRDPNKIKLMEDSIGQEEIIAISDCLKSGKYTQGDVVKEFEKKFAEWNGSKYSVMVNSGSSANLLMISALKEKFKLKDRDEILVPNVTWPTTVYPIIQNNLVPVFCDVDESFNISLDSIKKMTGEKTRAIFVVHLLGQPSRIKEIEEFCKERHLLLIEDCCESVGAKSNGLKVGNFGLAGSFSFYFGHHMTTIEGGMITTDDFELYDLLKSMRSHGWVKGTEREGKYTNIKNENFVFDVMGYNLRSTNLNAAIGLSQLKKLDSFIEQRKKNHEYFLTKIKDLPIIPQKINLEETSSFSLGIILPNKNCRDYLLEKLPEQGIECRPVVTGNLLRQPVFLEIDSKKDSQIMADIIHDRGLYLPNNQFMDNKNIDKIIETIKDLLISSLFKEGDTREVLKIGDYKQDQEEINSHEPPWN
ncbi:GDP-mannose 4,6-dehydratase [Candidatus Pacearchaeota archaeon]|nr:GDP-mannose 4,6-dehydratase [Candidatus Pacearchaeota archaeon]